MIFPAFQTGRERNPQPPFLSRARPTFETRYEWPGRRPTVLRDVQDIRRQWQPESGERFRILESAAWNVSSRICQTSKFLLIIAQGHSRIPGTIHTPASLSFPHFTDSIEDCTGIDRISSRSPVVSRKKGRGRSRTICW